MMFLAVAVGLCLAWPGGVSADQGGNNGGNNSTANVNNHNNQGNNNNNRNNRGHNSHTNSRTNGRNHNTNGRNGHVNSWTNGRNGRVHARNGRINDRNSHTNGRNGHTNRRCNSRNSSANGRSHADQIKVYREEIAKRLRTNKALQDAIDKGDWKRCKELVTGTFTTATGGHGSSFGKANVLIRKAAEEFETGHWWREFKQAVKMAMNFALSCVTRGDLSGFYTGWAKIEMMRNSTFIQLLEEKINALK
jgi:hypothetical protein